jgi:FtsZ-binding cell division protein ZapB
MIPVELIRSINDNSHTNTCRDIIRLIECRIDELREKNDTAEPDMVPKNQGAISELKHLRNILARPKKNLKQYDGAFV